MIFTPGVLIFDSAVYSVVVLPEPVGPVTSRMPCGRCSTSTKRCTEVLGETQRREIEHYRLAIEDTHHHRFAEAGRHGGDAQVQLLALHAQLNAAVLRQAALGDVELGHDLHAADHRGGGTGRRRFHFVQHAIDAVAHFQAILERLDMHVGCALFHRALQDQVDQADHRRLGREVAQMFHVIFFGRAAVEVFHDGAHRRATLAVITFDQIIDFRAQTDAERDGFAARKAHRLKRIGIGRIGHQQGDPILTRTHGHDMLLLEEADRDIHVGRRQFRCIACRQQRRMKALGPGFGQIALGNQAQARQQGGQRTFRRFFMQAPGTRQIVVFQAPTRHQQRAHCLFMVIRGLYRPNGRRPYDCRHTAPRS